MYVYINQDNICTLYSLVGECKSSALAKGLQGHSCNAGTRRRRRTHTNRNARLQLLEEGVLVLARSLEEAHQVVLAVAMGAHSAEESIAVLQEPLAPVHLALVTSGQLLTLRRQHTTKLVPGPAKTLDLRP